MLMSTDAPSPVNLYLVVGYDGSPPASRALDAAVNLLHGRAGRVEVVYVAHLPAADTLSANAVGQLEVDFDEIARDLYAAAGEPATRPRGSLGVRATPGPDRARADGVRHSHPGRSPRRHGGDRGRQFVAGHAPHRRLGRRDPGSPLTGARRGRALARARGGPGEPEAGQPKVKEYAGVMAAVAAGVKSARGTVVGILPGVDRERAGPDLSVVIRTGLGGSRNNVIINSGDAVIAVGGSWGTMAEIALAMCQGRSPVVRLGGWHILDEGQRPLPGIRYAKTSSRGHLPDRPVARGQRQRRLGRSLRPAR